MRDELSSEISRRMARLQNKNLPPNEDAKLRKEIGILNRQRMLRYHERRRNNL